MLKSLDQNKVNFALKEIIIMDIIQNQNETTSQEIQNSYLEVLNENYIHEKLLEPMASSPLKSKLKVSINNILSSNLYHSNGLFNRPELTIEKRGKTYYYKPSNNVIEDINNLFYEDESYANIVKMSCFHRKYPYLINFIRIVGFTKDYCEMNPSHIKEKGFYPIMIKAKQLDFGSIVNIRFICHHCVSDLIKKDYYSLLERTY